MSFLQFISVPTILACAYFVARNTIRSFEEGERWHEVEKSAKDIEIAALRKLLEGRML